MKDDNKSSHVDVNVVIIFYTFLYFINKDAKKYAINRVHLLNANITINVHLASDYYF